MAIKYACILADIHIHIYVKLCKVLLKVNSKNELKQTNTTEMVL